MAQLFFPSECVCVFSWFVTLFSDGFPSLRSFHSYAWTHYSKLIGLLVNQWTNRTQTSPEGARKHRVGSVKTRVADNYIRMKITHWQTLVLAEISSEIYCLTHLWAIASQGVERNPITLDLQPNLNFPFSIHISFRPFFYCLGSHIETRILMSRFPYSMYMFENRGGIKDTIGTNWC